MDNEARFLKKYSESHVVDDIFMLDYQKLKEDNFGKEDFESHVQASFIKE